MMNGRNSDGEREMTAAQSQPVIVAGNVYFCDFRRPSSRRPAARDEGAVLHTARDVRLTVETLQGACRDLIAGGPMLVRRAELNAADLVSVASMIDELAFQAHVMAIHGKDGVDGALDPSALQHALLEAAAVTMEIQGCMAEAGDAAETLTRRLREQAERALCLGRVVTEVLDAAISSETQAPL